MHGRGAKHGSVEHIISVWIHSRPVSNGDSFQSVFSRMPSLSHPKNHFWAPFSSWRHQRQFKTVRFLHPLPKVKVTGHFLHFFPKMPLFSSKKGSPNRPVPLANSFNGHPVFGSRKINGSNYRKDLQWSTLQMPLAKINYFPDEEGEGRTSVFLHYRMERSLRAIMFFSFLFWKILH